MSKHKHALSPAPLLPAKRLHGLHPCRASEGTPFDSVLYDELILAIFSVLDARTLCAVQATSRNCARLASDNQLWKRLFLREFGRARLRGGSGFYGRADGRPVRHLPLRPSTAVDDEEVQWKWMYRISANWRNGRCVVDSFRDLPSVPSQAFRRWHVSLAGALTILADSEPWPQPAIFLRRAGAAQIVLRCQSQLSDGLVSISALALDQSPASSRGTGVSLAAFLSTGEIYVYDYRSSSSFGARHRYVPPPHQRTPVVQAAYHDPLLVTLSQTFVLVVYDLRGSMVTPTQTLTSFMSHPPSSMVLSAISPTIYRLVLVYAVSVYPSHWSVGATELIIGSTSGSFSVSGTRSARTLDVPPGCWIDAKMLQRIRAQWARKVEHVVSTQTDGKWVVVAHGDLRTASLSPLQLYRLHMHPRGCAPRLAFVRTLQGPRTRVSALAVADGRCVALTVNRALWAWDLEISCGTQVGAPVRGTEMDTGNSCGDTVAFDARRMVSAGPGGVEERRFDV